MWKKECDGVLSKCIILCANIFRKVFVNAHHFIHPTQFQWQIKQEHFKGILSEVMKGINVLASYIWCQKTISGVAVLTPDGSQFVLRMISSTFPLIIRKFISVGLRLMFIVFWSLLVLNHNSSSPALFVITLMPLTYCRVSSSCAIITTFSEVNGFPMSQQAMAVNWTNWKNITPLREVACAPAWLARL